MTVEIFRIPAFSDNYLWVAVGANQQALVVDPGDATPIEAFLAARGLTLAAILVTHHHPDHTGGVDQLAAAHGCPIYGPQSARIPQVTHILAEGDALEVLGCTFSILEVPGHTLDHIAYFSVDADEHPVLFCGDTLFAGGCGRLFEGTPAQMLSSLGKLATLPQDTRIYCAHEYTLANLRFADAVEQDNSELQQRLAEVSRMRDRGEPTVPSTLAQELATNPFMRATAPSVRAAATSRLGHPPADAAETFAAIRSWKDNF